MFAQTAYSFAFAAWTFTVPAPIDDDVAQQIKRLGPEQSKEIRLAAIAEIERLVQKTSRVPGLANAIPDLERCAGDRDAKIRAASLTTLALVARKCKKGCPMTLIKALFDPDEDVRSAAISYHAMFDKYPKESVPFLIRALQHEIVTVRQAIPATLAKAGGKTKEVLDALEIAAKDNDRAVRNNALIEIWKLTKNWDRFVRHLIQCMIDRDSLGPLAPNVADEARKDHSTIDSIGIYAPKKLQEFGKTNPSDAGAALMKLLADPSPAMRCTAVRMLGALAIESPMTNESVKNLKAEGCVRKLLKDPDEKVREEAEIATKQITDFASGDWVESLIKKATSAPRKADRLRAILDLSRVRHAPAVMNAHSALDSLVQDKDFEIREEAVVAVALHAIRNKLPCPLAVVKALFDPDAGVRSQAVTYIGPITKRDVYPQEALPLLLRALEHEDAAVRGCAPNLIGHIGDKTQQVIDALEKATTDKDRGVRNNAEIALWKLTKDWDRYVRHMLLTVQAYEPYSEAEADKKPPAEKQDLELRSLLGIGAVQRLHDFGKESPERLAPSLIKHLSDKMPAVRRSAARILGAITINNPKAYEIVRKLDGANKVTKLIEDPDELVRSEARTALERIADKKP